MVSFIVPCYNLAHLLGECVSSILTQTHKDLEVLIMDDCSPDDTPGVARIFRDPRVRYVRNERNLGHLANYNRGLAMARGEYIWLISADDRLRSPGAVEQFVAVMKAHADVAYVFCPAVGLEGSVETGTLASSSCGARPFVVPGGTFLRDLLRRNSVAAPACMARKRYYDAAGGFPLDLPYSGDWYLWCRFAMGGDVAYVPAPLVNYRLHPASMTSALRSQRLQQIVNEEVAVRWRVMHEAYAAGRHGVVQTGAEAIAEDYAQRLALHRDRIATGMSAEEIERSIAHHASDERERRAMRGNVFGARGDFEYVRGNLAEARILYDEAIHAGTGGPVMRVKRALASLGPLGMRLRQSIAALRDRGAGGQEA